MTERLRSASTVGHPSPKMENDLSPRKTLVVLVIVVGCFAVLWPKVFYPMLVGSAKQHLKPSPIDKATGCCDVISEIDVNTIKIMSELCGTIIKGSEDGRPLSGKEIVQKCRQEVLDTCGIDISVVLQEQVRLGQSVKQILDEVRSLNGSLCLKYNYGVAPWRLGVPHRITVRTADSPNIRQERPMHLRSELVHPAFRERGRAIPQPQPVIPPRPPPRVVEGRPGPIPGLRPTIGGAGHVVPPSKQGTSSMSVIMPIYTIGIVVFFTYTLIKIIFKKQPDHVGGSLYPPVEPDPNFRKEVFESEASRLGPKLTRENISSKLVVNAMSALLDEVDQEIEARRKSSEVASQDLVNGTLSNGDAVKPQDEDQATVKVLGMEMTASCEGGKKWSRPDSPVVPTPSPQPPAEPVPPPHEIYLEGALPAQSQLLVTDSATEPEPSTGDDPAVVLSGKMTLSVISLDSENGAEETANGTEDVIIDKETFPEKIIETVATNIEEVVADVAKEIEEIPVKSQENIEEPVIHLEEEKPSRFEPEEKSLNIQNDLQKPDEETVQTQAEANVEETAARLSARVEEKPFVAVEGDIEKSVVRLEEEETTPTLTNIQEATLKFMEELLKEEDNLIASEVSPQVEDKIEDTVIKVEEVSLQESLIPDERVFGVESIDEVLKKEDSPITSEEIRLEGSEPLLFTEGGQFSGLGKDIEEFLQKLRAETDFQAPTITLDSEDVPHTLEVESLEKEVDELIQEALESIQQKEIVSELSSALDEKTNEISNDLKENETIEASKPEIEISNDTLEVKAEITTKVDLTEGISNEIEKLIQEVKSWPVEEPKLEVENVLKGEEDTIEGILIAEKIEQAIAEPSREEILISKKIEEAIAKPTEEEILISEKIEEAICEIDILPSQENLDTQKTEESTTNKDHSKVVPQQKEDIEVSNSVVEISQRHEESATVPTEETSIISKTAAKVKSDEETIATNVAVEEKIEKMNVEDVAAAKPSNVEAVEEKPKIEELPDDELGSDEELVEEIEEIVYEEDSGEEEEDSGEEEEIEIEVEESDEDIPDERNTNRTESSSVQRVNGEQSDDLLEESKYTTVSGATAAENEISDEELTDNEDVEEDEEIIEVEEEVDDDDYVNDLNHVSGESEPEL